MCVRVRMLTGVVGGVDVDVTLQQLFDHALDVETRRQDERRRAVERARVTLRTARRQQDLEDALRVGGDGGVKRRAPRHVLRVRVGT